MRFIAENNMILLPVVINNDTLLMLFDTGAAPTVVFDSLIVAKQKDTKMKPVRVRGLGRNEWINARQNFRNQIQAGPLKRQNARVIWIDSLRLETQDYFKHRIQGIIGMDFFRNTILKINYKTKTLTFIRPGKFKPPKRFFARYEIRYQRNTPVIQTKLNNRLVRLGIDTGNNDVLWLFNLPQSQSYRRIKTYLGKGFSGDIHGELTLIDSLHTGNRIFNRIPVAIPDTGYVFFFEPRQQIHGLMGNGFFRHFTLCLNFRQNRLWLRKSFLYSVRFPYDKSGIILQYAPPRFIAYKKKIQVPVDNYNRLSGHKPIVSTEVTEVPAFIFARLPVIKEIIPGTPAQKAGLQPGDLLKAVNGKYTFEMKDLAQVKSYFTGKNGETVHLIIIRNQTELKIKFKLKDYLSSSH